jgi:hypothetical protein
MSTSTMHPPLTDPVNENDENSFQPFGHFHIISRQKNL